MVLPLILLPVCPASVADAGSGLNWSITPYLWATETKVKLKAMGTPVGEGRVTFDDLVDVTDSSFQIVTEAATQSGKWSFFADVTHIDMSDTSEREFTRIDTTSEQWLADAAFSYWPRGEVAGFSLFVGARYIDLNDRFDFKLSENKQALIALENQRDFLDALIGLRQRFTLSERWSLFTRGDYSRGDSDGIFQLQATFRYALGHDQQYGLVFGYRYKEARFKYNALEERNKYYGPLLGFNLRF